jgi:hypothetical protein
MEGVIAASLLLAWPVGKKQAADGSVGKVDIADGGVQRLAAEIGAAWARPIALDHKIMFCHVVLL